MVEIADALASGIDITDITFIGEQYFGRKIWTVSMIILSFRPMMNCV